MSARIKYTDESLCEIEVVPDFLPPPDELAYWEDGVKVTLSPSKKSVDFFKSEHPFVGLPNGEERFAKAQLARLINQQIQERGLKQREAAELLSLTQPDVSNLANGRLSGFTFDRLYRCLYALDTDVEIVLKRHLLTDDKPTGIHVSQPGF